MIDKKDFTLPEELYFDDWQPFKWRLHPYWLYPITWWFIKRWHKTRWIKDKYWARYFPWLIPIYNRHKIRWKDEFTLSRSYAPIEYILIKAFMFLFESCNERIIWAVLRTIRQYLLKYDIHLVDRQLQYRPDPYMAKFDVFWFDRVFPIRKKHEKVKEEKNVQKTLNENYDQLLSKQDQDYMISWDFSSLLKWNDE